MQILERGKCELVSFGEILSPVRVYGSMLMKKEACAILDAGNLLMTLGLKVMRRYHEAKAAGQPADEVGRLQLVEGDIFPAVSKLGFQLLGMLLGTLDDTLH